MRLEVNKQPGLKSERGIALLLVLWIILLFSVICVEFSWTMRTETATAANFKEGAQAYYAAEAGVNRAILELMRTAGNLKQNLKKAPAKDEEVEENEETDYWVPGSGPYRFSFEGYTCEVAIEDESNKLGLNPFLQKAGRTPDTLKKLLEEQVGLEGEERDIVADSLIDWRDKDSNRTGVNGAEEDYYESLDPPRKCRNDEIPVLEELLLVRGVDERVFYGRAGAPEQKIKLSPDDLEKILSGQGLLEEPEEEPDEMQEMDNATGGLGLRDIFSTVSSSSVFKINVNTASLNQLLLLDGMDRETAREILTERNTQLYQSSTDRLPQFKNYAVWRGSIKTGTSTFSRGFFTIRSRGRSADGRVARQISCSVVLTKSSCTIYNWKAD